MQMCQKKFFSAEGYFKHTTKKHDGKYTYTYLELQWSKTFVHSFTTGYIKPDEL